MANPFAKFANLIVVFKNVVTFSESTDGNKQGAATDFILTAFVQQAGVTATVVSNEYSGGSTQPLVVTGNCISPKSIPPNILPSATGYAYLFNINTIGKLRLPASFSSKAALDSFVANNARFLNLQGSFQLSTSIDSSFGVNRLLGSNIKGEITTSNTYAEVV